jgi:hypothetical protein
MLLLVRCGAALESRLWPAEGGVRGRELEPETLLLKSAYTYDYSARKSYRELKLSMSACEYDAPIIFLLCVDAFEVLEVVRQKGEFELHTYCQRPHRVCAGGLANVRRAVCWQQNDMLATLDAMTPAAMWKCTNRPGPFPEQTMC